MSDENKQNNEEITPDNSQPDKPKIFALKRQNGGWAMNRKSFIEAASTAIGAVAFGVGGTPPEVNAAEDVVPPLLTGKLVYAHKKGVKSLAISSGGKWLASGGADGILKLWTLPNGAFSKSATLGETSLESLVFGADGKSLISGASGSSNERITFWKYPELEQDRQLPIVPAPNQSTMAAGIHEAVLEGNVSKVRALLEGDSSIISQPDGNGDTPLHCAARLGYLEVVKILVANGANTHARTKSSGSTPYSLAKGFGHKEVAAYLEQMAPDTRSAPPKAVGPLKSQPLPLNLAISHDGAILATGGRERRVRLWKLQDGSIVKDLEVDQNARSLETSFSIDGKRLFILNGSKQISVRSIPKFLSEGELPSDASTVESDFNCLAITPDGQTLITGLENGTLQLISLGAAQVLKSLRGHAGRVNALAITPDGKWLASGSDDKNIMLWSLQDGSLMKTLTGHSEKVNALAITPDGKLLASGSDDKTIRLWSLPEGKEVARLMDLSVNHSTAQGIQYKSVNEYGQTVTYTLPCGSPIPAGAVCTCNCVPGTLTIPRGYTQQFSGGGVCSCDTICTCVPVCTCQSVCSCVSVCTCQAVGGGGHYWYPN